MTHRWTGAHPYRDHANGRTVEPGEVLPDDIADRVADAHPFDVEEADKADNDSDICGAELSGGGTCDRPIDECPYESHRE